MTPEHQTSLAIALAHAARNREVFPTIGKLPLVRWTIFSTADITSVKAMWKRHPDADGVGWKLPIEAIVLDVDDPHLFMQQGLDLPESYIQETPRGFHILWRRDTSREIRQGPIPGADLKVGGKGYVRLYSEDAFTRRAKILPE